MQKDKEMVVRGQNSVELRSSKNGEEYLKLDWRCSWNNELVLDLGRSQMRTMLFFKHKFADTFVVMVTWLTLYMNANGQEVTYASRRKYRVNLKTRKVTTPHGNKAVSLEEWQFLHEGTKTLRYGFEQAWAKESLEKELLIMTNYADMMWRAMEKRNTNRVEL